MYLQYVIGGKLKIDLMKMEYIIKWPIPNNVTKTRSFIRAVEFL
jgi:hypothetical protein